jgi:hypothetical protein
MGDEVLVNKPKELGVCARCYLPAHVGQPCDACGANETIPKRSPRAQSLVPKNEPDPVALALNAHVQRMEARLDQIGSRVTFFFWLSIISLLFTVVIVAVRLLKAWLS